MSESKSTYFRDLYRDLYYREVATSQAQMGRIALPITITTLLVGAIGFIFRELTSAATVSGWGCFWWWVTAVFAMISAVFSVKTIASVIKTVWPKKLAAFPLAGEIEAHAKELRAHNASWLPKENTSMAIEAAVDEWLKERYRDGGDEQAGRNRERATYLASSFMGLSISTIFILAGLGSLTGVYLTRSTAASQPPNAATIPTQQTNNSLPSGSP